MEWFSRTGKEGEEGSPDESEEEGYEGSSEEGKGGVTLNESDGVL